MLTSQHCYMHKLSRGVSNSTLHVSTAPFVLILNILYLSHWSQQTQFKICLIETVLLSYHWPQHMFWLRNKNYYKKINIIFDYTLLSKGLTSADPEGGQVVRTSPGKSQVIWVSIGNKELDPPGKSWTPLWKMLDPLWNLEK